MDEIAAEIEGLKLDIKWLQNELAMQDTAFQELVVVVEKLKRDYANIDKPVYNSYYGAWF